MEVYKLAFTGEELDIALEGRIVTEELDVTVDGTYELAEGVDGFSKVTVDVLGQLTDFSGESSEGELGLIPVSDYEAIVAAVNEHTGETEDMASDKIAGVIASDIPKILFGTRHRAYTRIPKVTYSCVGLGESHNVWCSCGNWGGRTAGTLGIEEAYYPEVTHTCGHYGVADGNYTLKRAILPKLTNIGDGYLIASCTGLEYIQIGSVGHPVTCITTWGCFTNCTNVNLMLEIYVDAATLADISTDITAGSPWGATNATIVYRNSTTGEVITE